MTKLLEWVFVTSTILGIWCSLVTKNIDIPMLDKWMPLIVPLPIILVLLFGLYAAMTVLYRTFTFNDCKEAAAELQTQILEAKADLRSKGFVFKEDKYSTKT